MMAEVIRVSDMLSLDSVVYAILVSRLPSAYFNLKPPYSGPFPLATTGLSLPDPSSNVHPTGISAGPADAITN